MNLVLVYTPHFGMVSTGIGTPTSDVGALSYRTYPGWGCQAGPHAVVYTSGSIGATGYCYDANGNMTHRWIPGGAFIYYQQWTADNKISQIDKLSSDGNYTYLGTAEQFSYDADGARVKTTTGQPASPATDSFDTIDTNRWETGPAPSTYTIVNQGGNNVIQVIGDGTYSWWTGGFQFKSARYGNPNEPQNIVDGQTVSMDFKLSDLHSGATLAIEGWDGSGYYRRLGIFNWNNDLRVQTCSGGTCNDWTTAPVLYNVGQLQANVWYRVIWVLGGSSGVKLQVNERDTGGNPVSYDYTGLPSGQKWRFHFWVNTYNPTYLDNYNQRGTTTVYAGNFEKNLSTNEVTKYYTFGGQRIAMRQSQTSNMETPSLGSGNTAYQYAPTGSEWSWLLPASNSGAGLTGNNSAFTSGGPNAPEGAQVAFIQNNGGMQRLVGSSAGQYQINYKATQRHNAGTGSQTLRVWVDGTLVDTFTPTSGATYDMRNTAAFALSVGSHVIRIEGTVTTGDATAFVDAVSLDKVSWLHSDHLGSASLATNNVGGVVANSDQRFAPFGTPRLTGSALPSKYTFTGQRNFMDEIGTMDYGARQYSPLLGRFLSADSIVPSPGDPQSLNRFSYVRNSPLGRIDPTGHGDCDVYSQAGCQPWWISDQPLPTESLIITRKGGLIDTHHAGVTDIIAQVKNATQPGTDNKYKRAGALGIGLKGHIVFGSHKAEYAIAKGLNDKQVKQVALGIWMDYQIRFEQAQSDHGDVISGFAAEDLFSDLMGFYQELTGKSLQEIVNGDLGGVIGTMGEVVHAAYVGNAAIFNCCEWVNRSHEFKPFRPDQDGSGEYFDMPAHIKQELGVAIGQTNKLWRLVSFESSGGLTFK